MTSTLVAPQGRNFVSDEERLCKSWLHISEDPIIGNGQKNHKFWERVEVHYNANKPHLGLERPARFLEMKWGNIEHDVSKFCSYHHTINALRESGTTDADVLPGALEMFKSKHPKNHSFCVLGILLVLKDVPKWADHKEDLRNAHRKIGVAKHATLQDINNTSPFGGVVGGQNDVVRKDDVVGKDVVGSLNDGSKRPLGNKNDKEADKKGKLLDNALYKSAKMSVQIGKVMVEKIAFLKEQAIVAICSMRDNNGHLSQEGSEYFKMERQNALALYKAQRTLDPTFVPPIPSTPVEDDSVDICNSPTIKPLESPSLMDRDVVHDITSNSEATYTHNWSGP